VCEWLLAQTKLSSYWSGTGPDDPLGVIRTTVAAENNAAPDSRDERPAGRTDEHPIAEMPSWHVEIRQCQLDSQSARKRQVEDSYRQPAELGANPKI
jgi:hypothetical protein